MSYKAKIFTREEFREVVAAAIYDYEHAPAKCLYTTKDAADQLYGEYGEERLALKACAQCPAICECARYAAQHDRISGYPLQGVWGGVNRSRRRNRNE